ncbi:MAG: hypothetical protein JJ59_00140 [Candidatus Micrarchaeum sp. AZ1]|nr:MAG: hypothetical protein JJ59_00140 [Candidatus Micrarchaeum sp. AZ1]
MQSKETLFLYLAIAIILIFSSFQPVWMFKNSVYVHEDTPFIGITYSFNEYISGLWRSVFIYNPNIYTGTISSGAPSVIGFIYSMFMLIPNIVSGILSAELSGFIMLAIGGLGCFFFLHWLLSDYNYRLRITLSLLGFLVFFAITGDNIGPVAFLPFAFLFLLKFLEFNKHGTRAPLLDLAIFVIFLATFFAFGGYTYLIQNFIFIASALLILFIFYGKNGQYKQLFSLLLITFVLALLINASFIADAYLLSKNPTANSYYNFMTAPQKYAFGYPNILTTLDPVLSSGNDMLYISSIIIFAISVFTVFIIEPYQNNKKTKVILALLISFLVITFFYNTIAKPFGSLYTSLVNSFKALYSARYGGEFVPMLGFIFAVLFANSIGSLINKFNKRFFTILICLIAIIIILPTIYYIDIFPYTNYSYYTQIPTHVYKLSDYINANVSTYNVAMLPSAAGFQFLASWYTGTDIYSYLINAPVFTGGYVAQTEIFYPITKYYFDTLTNNIDNSKINNKKYISNLFGVIGIKYIIIQGNAVGSSKADLNYGDPFSFNTIYYNLNNSAGLSFVSKFSNSSLYVNKKVVPLVYGSDLINLGNASLSRIFASLENESFNIYNMSAFSTNITGFYSDKNTMNATQLNNFADPSITFVQNTPTKITVHISNATTPYYLVFRETYDPHWSAFYSNGTMVNQSYHIAVNGFANAWYISKPGNYTVTLYYTLQTDAWEAWAVSFAALGITIAIGVYGWKKSRRKYN